MIGTKQFFGIIDFHSRKKNTMEVNGAQQLFGSNRSSKYLSLCSAEERKSYRFATVNDHRIFIFGWSIPFSTHKKLKENTNKPTKEQNGLLWK